MARRAPPVVCALAAAVLVAAARPVPSRAESGPTSARDTSDPPPSGREAPATRAAARVVDVLARIRNNLRRTRYQHRTVVREARGLYAWDCSAMVTWVLRRAAPRARRAIYADRPVAKYYFDAIDAAPTDGSRRGWRKLTHIAQARPGDVFAWLRPPDWPQTITGHVGFLLERPRRLDGKNAYVARVADATSLPHQNDTRERGDGGGYGEGTLLFVTDGDGSVTGYGWFGTRSPGTIDTRVVFGRVHR